MDLQKATESSSCYVVHICLGCCYAFAPTRIAAPPVASSSTIIEAKIGDLPRYREMILAAIRANPGRKSIALATVLEKSYAVRVHQAALRTFIDREKLYDAANAAPSTHMRGTGAPSTPTGATIQSSPIRASPRKKVHAKLSDLPRYRHRIVEAIKANPGKREKALSAVLEANYALVVHYQALQKYCKEHKYQFL